jgi:hypothetical protein
MKRRRRKRRAKRRINLLLKMVSSHWLRRSKLPKFQLRLQLNNRWKLKLRKLSKSSNRLNRRSRKRLLRLLIKLKSMVLTLKTSLRKTINFGSKNMRPLNIILKRRSEIPKINSNQTSRKKHYCLNKRVLSWVKSTRHNWKNKCKSITN